MAIPSLEWSEPLNSPDTVADGHILRNDLVTISRKAPSSPAIAGVEGGKYYARFNDVDRTINPEVSPSPGPGVDANTVYTFVDRGHISLEGGVWELLPFSSGVSPATTVEYVDFAGTGHSPYPVSYGQIGANPSEAGILLCGVKANVESSHTYRISQMVVMSAGSVTYGDATPTPWTAADGTNPAVNASLNGTQIVGRFGVTTASPDLLYFLTNGGVVASSPADNGWDVLSTNKISEDYTVGGSFHNGTSVLDVHTGSILFERRYDTLATISGGNERRTVTGTASWATGQGRSVTFTTDTDHLLADANNRVYISGASNNAINGLWNVASVTNSTVFTTQIFGAHCGPGSITSDVTIETYDGIDKTGGILKQSSGTVTSIVERKVGYSASGTNPAYHERFYDYTGSHGVASSGAVVINIDSTSSGTASNFAGSVTRTSGTVLTRTLANGSGNITSSTTIWTGSATVYESANDVEIIGGGMNGNNQVILAGEVPVSAGASYGFFGNSTTTQVSTITFTGTTQRMSMFDDAGFVLDTASGRVHTNGAPSTQPSGTDGMPGGFDPSTNPTGGVKEIDSWCPKYVHAKQKALERADISEQLKANTSGKFALDQMINSPIVDDDGNVTTLLVPRDGFHEMCWFTIRALKNPSHRRTSTFVENEDYIDRRFGIKVYSNSSSDRNEVILDYVDITNKDNVANTDTAFVNKDRVAITNREHLALGYANGTFKNQA